MLACSYYFLMSVWQMLKVVTYHAQHLQYASCIRWLLVLCILARSMDRWVSNYFLWKKNPVHFYLSTWFDVRGQILVSTRPMCYGSKQTDVYRVHWMRHISSPIGHIYKNYHLVCLCQLIPA
jgi:hypothetical protein